MRLIDQFANSWKSKTPKQRIGCVMLGLTGIVPVLALAYVLPISYFIVWATIVLFAVTWVNVGIHLMLSDDPGRVKQTKS